MASKKWIELPGGRVKRWKSSDHHTYGYGVPPHWARNIERRRRRRRTRDLLQTGQYDAAFPGEVKNADRIAW